MSARVSAAIEVKELGMKFHHGNDVSLNFNETLMFYYYLKRRGALSA
jgi:hypothetical protein